MDKWSAPGYTELSMLGSGGFGAVVLARHEESGSLVAVKYLRPELLDDPGFAAMFRDEARVLASIDDPNVVRLYEYFESPWGAAIVMELVDGVSLRDILSRQGGTSPEAALVVLQGSLLGLAAAHARGVVHRDYKPANVLVDGAGVSKLTDFGIAIRAGDRAVPAGTLAYAPPEQFSGGPASPAGDVYAATATFYECLTGRPPFTGDTEEALLSAHRSAPVPLEPVPEALRPLVAAGMAKDPGNRPADAASLVTELRAAAAPAYGPDWEERGLSHLSGAALLLAALWPSGTTPAVSGHMVEQLRLTRGSQGQHLEHGHAGHAQHVEHAAHAQHAAHAEHLQHAEHLEHVQHAEHAAHVQHLEHVGSHNTAHTAARALTHVRRAANLTRRALSAGHGAGAAVAGAAVAAVVVVALLPSGHKPAVPPPAPTFPGSLLSVTATSTDNAWAVGCPDTKCTKAFIVHWNGTTWAPEPIPDQGTSYELTSVAATSASNAWAVGRTSSGQSVILHWNGITWARLPSPDLGTTYELNEVAVTSADNAWAAGPIGASTSSNPESPILRWNGTTWTQVAYPHSKFTFLWGVTVASASDAWAFGYTFAASVTTVTLILHWNGTTWARVASPSTGADPEITDITASSANSAWAIGTSDNDFSDLFFRWNGSTWTTLPNPAPAGSYLPGMAATPAGAAWAVGSTGSGTSARILILQWKGTAWARVPSPDPGPDAGLGGVTALSNDDAWAVGGANGKTLILHWNGTAWK